MLGVCAFSIFLSLGGGLLNAQTQRAKEAIDVIVLFCVAGGSTISVAEENSPNSASIANGSKRTSIRKSDARGLVEGINSAISQLSADQADKARECMKPYLKQILDIVLKTDANEDKTNINIYWPPVTVPCRLSFRIEIAGKTVIPQGPYTPVFDVPVANVDWAVIGRVDCADGSLCISNPSQSMGKIQIRENQLINFFWSIAPGSLKGSPCLFSLS